MKLPGVQLSSAASLKYFRLAIILSWLPFIFLVEVVEGGYLFACFRSFIWQKIAISLKFLFWKFKETNSYFNNGEQ